ncbi:HNH endonuclease [Collimonas antrihumi]|uniref:HNH endonuclease n=1 Tax=Collimonas antrihumi TaxID=1940615 RepID=UPI001B8BEC8E|nr:HNH endonuclease [Collimonas antrihumi]
MNSIDKARSFHSQNYRKIAGWVVEPGKEIILGNQGNRVCRFCAKRAPEVSFRLSAHALPESMGNKSLFAAYECDECNAFFGSGIESDFGNWSKPMRTLARIRGKNGVSVIRHQRAAWHIGYDDISSLATSQFKDDPTLAVDLHTRQVMLQRDPYTLLAVLTAFVKMGLSVIPDNEMPNFAHALHWIRTRDHRNSLALEFPVMHTFALDLMPNDKINVLLIRRKDGSRGVPYVFFILAYGNEMFQVMLRSPERDPLIDTPSFSANLSMYPFPPPNARFDSPRQQSLDFSGRQLIQGEIVPMPIGSEKKDRSARSAGQTLFGSNAEQPAPIGRSQT